MSAGLCWLRLVLLATCTRFFSGAERDSVSVTPAELIKSSSIPSTEDLQLLLLPESVADGDPEGYHAKKFSSRLPRSFLDAQPAQQAQCKVRTEVMEVTRSMLDRSNANFLLWPPCVEVQRCSGCCNTKSLKCVPVVTHTRYLQVMKIQYSNTRPVYNKALVTVNDHVECRCQPAPRRKSPNLKQETRERSGKPRYKDELKPNQRLKLEDLLSHSWLPMEKQSGDDFGNDRWSWNKTHHGRSRGKHHGDERNFNNSNTNSTDGGSLNRPTVLPRNYTGVLLQNVTKEKQKSKAESEIKNSTKSGNGVVLWKYGNIVSPTEISRLSNQIPQYESDLIQRNKSSCQLNTDCQLKTNLKYENSEPPVIQTNQTHTPVPNPTSKSNQRPGDILNSEEEKTEKTDNEFPELENTDSEDKLMISSTTIKERKTSEEDKEELLLLKIKDKKHNQRTTTQRTETTSSTPVKVISSPPRLPPRPQKRWRKHRNRISKAVMRALLM